MSAALPSDCHAYVLNLARAPQRLAAMQARLSALGVAFTRIEGVDGATLAADALAALTRRNRYYKPLRPGEVGCYLGHVEALRSFLASPAHFCLLLEDDACFEDGFLPALAAALERRRAEADPLCRWDVLKLCNRRRRWMPLAPLAAGHCLVEYGPSVPSTTTAAVWTREGATRFLAAFSGVSRPVDCDLQHPWESGLRILSVHPPVVSAEPVPSTIGGGKPRSRNPWPKLRYEALRLWPRWRHFSRLYGPLFWRRWRRGEGCPPLPDHRA
ncbi:MAG: glycosyltransferase family 25 protein [Thermomonas sp.]